MTSIDFVQPHSLAGDGRERPLERRRALSHPALAAAGVALADAAALAIAAGAALALLPAASDYGAAALAFVAACVLGVNAVRGLYPGYRVHGYELVRRRATTVFAAMLAVSVGVCLLGATQLELPLTAMLIGGLVLQLALVPLARSALNSAGVWGEPAAILAGSNAAALLRDYFTANWQYGIRPTLGARPGRGSPEPRPSLALVALDTFRSDDLAALRQAYSDILLLADVPHHGVAGLRPMDLNGEIGVRIGRGNRVSGRSLLIRALDLAVALPLTLAAAPVIAAAALAIRMVDPGPVFFRHVREGFDGRPLAVLKLRTMYRDAEARLETLIATDPGAAAEWRTHFKLRNDPRILPVVGRILRATSLDELPQLLNIVAGEMTLVGPRPFPDYHLSAMRPEFREKRRTVVPGLTGLWQISERSNADVEQQEQLDGYYIDNRNFWLDLDIIVRTFGVVLKQRGV